MTKQDPLVHGRPGAFDFRLLVEESLAGIYVIQGSRFLYVNPAMAGLFGYAPDELVACATLDQLVDPADRERVRENLRRRFEGEEEVLQYSFQARRRDGSTFRVEVRGRRVTIDGHPAVVGTLLDVSDRAQELERLRFLSRAAELLDSSLDYEVTLESLAQLMIPSFADFCIIDVGYDGTIRRLAAARDAVSGHGYTVEPGQGNGTGWTEPLESLMEAPEGTLVEEVPEERRAEIAARVPAGAFGGAPVGDVRSAIVVPLNARGCHIGTMLLGTTDSGRLYRTNDFEFAREVARAAALAVDNAHLYRLAQEAVRRRDEVLAIVSHDLRNPLNAILMSTAIALEQDRRQQGPLVRVHKAAKQMERLIRDLLDLSAIDAGGFSVEPERVPLREVVDRTVELLEETASARGVRIEVALDDPELEIPADEDRLVQALSNLLANAIKFSPSGSAVRVRTSRANGSVDLAVADHGPGIPPDQTAAVFERFWRGRSDGVEGAGLGLAIVKGIAEAHGGHVRVESCPGEGATFHLELPAA